MTTSREMNPLMKALVLAVPLTFGIGYGLQRCGLQSHENNGLETLAEFPISLTDNGNILPEDNSMPEIPMPKIRDPLNEPPYTAFSADEPEKSSGLAADVPISALAQNIKKKIVLDAGHGMGNRTGGLYDPGAVIGDVQEADLNLRFAQEVEGLLKEKGYEVIQTRRDNVTEVSLDKRTSIANYANADLFVSVHCNASTSENSRGVIIYNYPGSERGESAAILVRKGLVKILDEEVEDFDSSLGGIREETFYVLKHTKMPSILIEAGFLTNGCDRKYLISNKGDIARGIADGIDSYFKGKN